MPAVTQVPLCCSALSQRAETRAPARPQFLCDGLEQDVAMRKAGLSTTELLTVASGKMLLLHKLLPKLRREGHKAGSQYPVSCARDVACMTHSKPSMCKGLGVV